MKNHIILLLAVGLSSVAAKSFEHGDNKPQLSDINDAGTNHKEEPSNNNETEQNNVINGNTELKLNESLEEDLPKYEESVDIIITENNEVPVTEAPFDLQEPLLFDVQENDENSLEDEYVPVQETDYFYNDLINKDPNEIMDTASGFVPIPIFRRKQKPRRQYPNRKATRRYNRRPYPYYPYSRYYFYPYYGFYRPSSLRFY